MSRKKQEVMMDEKLIMSVRARPELYDASSDHYRDRDRRDLAWRRTSQEVGVSEEICRKRWKSLRDTYVKESRKEREKRTGTAQRWRFFAVLSFLDPCISPRETQRSDEGQAAGCDHQASAATTTAATASGLSGAGEIADRKFAEILPDPESPLQGPPAVASAQSDPSSAAAPSDRPKKRAKRKSQELTVFERELLAALRARAAAPAPCSADEHFLRSLLPLLQNMPPQSKEFVKFQIHKLLFVNSTFLLHN